MQSKSKPISIEEINKIELRNDGKDGKRFESMLRKVVNVSKKEIEDREKVERNTKNPSQKAALQ